MKDIATNFIFYKLLMILLVLTLFLVANNIPLVAVPQDVDTKKPMEPSTESSLTYIDTIYGISINYPSSWEIEELASQYLLSVLENISSSESQGIKIGQNNEIISRVSHVLEAFGLEKVSEVLGLEPDVRLEFFQKISQAVNEGTLQMIVAIVSPPEDEFDVVLENMNIVVENISTLSAISLNDYVSANIEGMKVAFPGFKMIEPTKEIIVDGNRGISFVYTGSAEGPEQDKVLQVYIIKGDMGYILTFGTPMDTYSMYLPVFQRMLESFKISS